MERLESSVILVKEVWHVRVLLPQVVKETLDTCEGVTSLLTLVTCIVRWNMLEHSIYYDIVSFPLVVN